MTRDDVCDAIVARILDREGGVAQLPGEGFVTRYGQTPDWLKFYGLPAPLSRDDAAANYRRWLTITRLEVLCTADDILADSVIDWAVNAGVGVAVRALQSAIGARPDGVIGPQTVEMLEHADRGRAARQVVADRVRHYGRLVTENPGRYAIFARGWLNRAASLIEGL